MKMKYLPQEDRQNLRMLRHTTEEDVIVSVLESIFRRPTAYTLQALWEYRKWFLELSDDRLRRHPALTCGLIQILLLQGDLDQARELLKILPENSPYHALSVMTVPGSSSEEMHASVQCVLENDWALPSLALTAGRPTVFNGVWDLTPYMDRLLEDKEGTLKMIETLFPGRGESIYDIIWAEALYQQDRCYDALVLAVSRIPFLKDKKDLRVLFAALTLETYILVLNGQAPSSEPLMKNLRQQVIQNDLEEYIPNIDALSAWAAMYDGDYVRITKWLRENAPDEYGRFCMLDLFRYMVKMRAYIIFGKYLSVTALANRLLPILEAGKRYMDLCELHAVWAMSDAAAGRKDEALDHLEQALALAEQYRYDRLLADEGVRMLELLKSFHKERGSTPYSERICRLAEKTAVLHPRYLKHQLPEKPPLTEAELRVLRLIAACYTNAEIANLTGITVDTVKQHCKHICAKLEVRNRHQAVQRAVELGMIENPSPGMVSPYPKHSQEDT